MDWFKHRTGSHDDPDIQDARDKFGDFAYSGFFIICEVFGQEFSHIDSNGWLRVSKAFVRRKLNKSWGKVELLLNFYEKRNRIKWKKDAEDSSMIFLTIPKFIEIASNWTKRTITPPPEAPPEAPTAKEVEEEEKKKKSKSEKVFSESSPEYKLAVLHVSLLDKNHHPWKKGKKPDLQKWASQYDSLTRVDEIEPKEIQDALVFALNDHVNDGGRWRGWAGVIHSPDSLRRGWEKVVAEKNGSECSSQQAAYKTCIHLGCGCRVPMADNYCPACRRKQ